MTDRFRDATTQHAIAAVLARAALPAAAVAQMRANGPAKSPSSGKQAPMMDAAE